MSVEPIISRCEEIFRDNTFAEPRAWKDEESGRRVIGYLPVYVPVEVVHAAGMLPVGILGGGEDLEVIKGDAYFQSYICRIPRSTLDLGLTRRLDFLDGVIFPSTCDVIRNLSGMWKILFPDRFVHYLDLPQNFSPEAGGVFYRADLDTLRRGLAELGGRPQNDDDLRASIRVYNRHRELLRVLYSVRAEQPWRVPASEAYLLLRAGMVMPVEKHCELLRTYLDAVALEERRPIDNCRVVVVGTFCEQPPLGLIRTLERAGCDIVDDDWMLGNRWFGSSVDESGDPLDALVHSFLVDSQPTASKYEPDGNQKGVYLVENVRRLKAEGVIFASPSFCDPALLDRPMLQRRLDGAGISHTSFKYAENSGQMQPIREQAGTFADSLKLWGEA